ncbi:MAG: acyl-CoA dehydrogenase [Rhodocyclales bacterium]|nr:acyl-CoA dehydrogenase [Rhodocyclales bacterium]
MLYQAPLRDMQFILEHLVGFDAITALPGCAEVTPDLAAAVLDEAARFATGVLAPLDRPGDRQGCRLEGGQVRTPGGWQDAWRQFAAGGWLGLGMATEHGGQGLPKILATPVSEMWSSANLSFSLLPPLNASASEALRLAADERLKAMYLPQLASGEWAGTMCLTESQAGSDLGAIRTRAVAHADGSYRLFGQKIFITYGDHELTSNIVHLVLARTPDAPPGVKGISMFVVPKFLVGADGSLGARNDVQCVAIEHKLGLHGSPTCVMSFGEAGGAVGYLVGEVGRGLEYMFVMMNEMRFGSGLQGPALAERAYQQAVAFARERVQGRGRAGAPVPIIQHADVKRMLLTMRAKLMAARTLSYVAAGWFDIAARHEDDVVAGKHRRLVDLLMPVLKGWNTEVGNEVCELAVQIHGGAGFVEETGIAQHYRDARITTIYEGTTGIQAGDLVGRKILREGGATLTMLVAELRTASAELATAGLAAMSTRFAAAINDVEATLRWILECGNERLAEVQAGSVPVLRQLGLVCGAWQLGRAALAAHRLGGVGDGAYHRGMVGLAEFYFAHLLPQASAWAAAASAGAAPCIEFPEELL